VIEFIADSQGLNAPLRSAGDTALHIQVIDQHPQARSLFLAYCRRTDPELLKSYQFSVGAACEAADAIAVEAWGYNAPKFLERQPVGVADVTFQSRLLNQAADLYSKSKEHTLQVHDALRHSYVACILVQSCRPH
jgi:hypothetical protein